MQAPSPARVPRSRLWLAGLLIVLAGLAAYHNSFTGPLVFDDQLSIAENPTLRSLLTAWAPPRGQGATVEGRPLLNFSLALSQGLAGGGTTGHHALNLAIHLGAGLALFGLSRRTLALPGTDARLRAVSLPLALCLALLWVVHPLQTESVTYIVQRAESQMGLFFLLTLYCLVRGGGGGKGSGAWLTAATVCCWLGAATKEVMAAAPVLALLHDRTFLAGSFRGAWRARRITHAALFSSWLLVAVLVWSSGNRGGTVGFGSHVPWWDYALTQCDAIAHYVKLALWPHPLVFDYGPELRTSLTGVLPPAVLTALLVGGTLYALVRRPAWGFLGFWFLALLAPTSLIPGNRQALAEHRMYLSLAPLLAALVIGVFLLLGGRRAPSAWPRAALLLATLAAGLGCITVRRNEDYRTELALYRDTAAKRPCNAFAHYNLAKLLAEGGAPAAAIPEYEAALRVRPGFPAALFNLGNALAELGRLSPAEEAFRDALRLTPEYPQAHYNLGNVLLRLGRKSEAADQFAAAARQAPGFFAARENLGSVWLELGRLDDARAEFEAVLRLRPESAAAHFGLGNVSFLEGRLPEAVRAYERALQLSPDLPPARGQLARARALLAPSR